MSRLLVSVVLAAALAGCNGSGGALPVAPAAAAPEVTANSPAADLAVTAGETVEVRYTDRNDGGETDVVAVSLVTGAEYAIAAARPHQDGVEQVVMWDTTGMPPGEYAIELRSRLDGKESVEVAGGKVTISAAPAPGGGSSGGGFGSDLAFAAAAFTDGSYAAGGQYQDFMEFPNGVSLSDTPPNSGFVARYGSDGSFQWARGTSSERGVRVVDLAALADGSLACAGRFGTPPAGGDFTLSAGEADAVTITTGETPGVNAGHSFVARFAEDGSLLWAQGILSRNFSVAIEGTAAAPDPSGGADGILVVGTFRGRTVFGFGTASETEISIPTNQSLYFIARYDADGTFRWVKHGAQTTGFARFAEGVDIDAFADGSFVIAGDRGGDLVLGVGEANETTLDSGPVAFVARFDADGNLEWVRNGSASDVPFTHVRGVAAAADGATYFHHVSEGGTATYPGSPPQGFTIPASEVASVIVRFDEDGNALWVKTVPGSTYSFNCLATTENAVLMTGGLNFDDVFGEGEPNETELFVSGGDTFFAARWESDGSLGWARQATGTNHNLGEAIAGYPGGASVVAGYFYGMMTLDTGGELLDFETVGGQDFFASRLSD